MLNFVHSSDLIEVYSFGYYDESKKSVTGYPQERPDWILAKDIFFVARVSFDLERAILTSPDLAYFFFPLALTLATISSAFSPCKTNCFQVQHSAALI